LGHLTSAEKNTLPKTILIAPPNAAMAFNKQRGLQEGLIEEKISVIAGAKDNYVDITALTEHYTMKTQVIADADHFFSGQRQALDTAVTTTLNEKLSD
jgi:alpha/beta superfamily hydrolase